MGLSRLYPVMLAVAGALVALLLLLPYRSVPFERSDGERVQVLPLTRFHHTSDIWDYLQLGRSLRQGHGFTSLFTYPPFLPESVAGAALALGSERSRGGERFPLYWRQPGYPVLVAGSFLLRREPDPGALLWLQGLAVVLLPLTTYLLARRLLSPGWATLAGLWALLSPVAIGVRSPLAATTWFAVVVAFLAARGLTTTGLRSGVGLGILTGLAVLFRLETWILLPGLLLMVWLTLPRRRVAATLLLLAAAVVVVSPWNLRLAALTGDPFYNVSSLFFHDTEAFPGWAASRTLSVREISPAAFVLENWGNVLEKTLHNLLRFGRDLLFLPSPALAPFVWLALLRPPQDRRGRALVGGGALCTLALVLTLSPMQYASRFLGGLVPVLAVAAAVTLCRWPGFGRLFAGAATAVGVGVLGVSLLGRPETGTAATAAADLNRLMLEREAASLREGAVALSNAPTLYAWIWERPAVWAPLASDLGRVREILPATIGVFTCATGHGDSLGPRLSAEYTARGGRRTDPDCPTLVVWVPGESAW